MEFIQWIQSKNFENFESLKSVVEAEPYHMKIKTDDAYPTLYLICGTENTSYVESWMKECNGLILEKETNRIVCYTFDKMDDFEDGVVDSRIDPSTSHFEISVEGALMRLFYYQGQWILSTKRCINARRTHWLSKKSFHEMFEEVYPMSQMTRLNENHCYSFVLCHPKNSMVVKYDKGVVYHISTRDMQTMQEIEVDVGVEKVPRMEIVNGDISLLGTLSTTTNLSYEGYLLVDGNFRRQKFQSVIFKRARELWGNTNHRFYRYLEIRKMGPTVMTEYLSYMPHEKNSFVDYESKMVELGQYIWNEYMDRHIRKTGKETPYYLKRIIYDLHGEFLSTREKTSVEKIMKWIEKLDVKLQCFFYLKMNEMNQSGGNSMQIEA
jgi:hypothetical protein